MSPEPSDARRLLRRFGRLVWDGVRRYFVAGLLAFAPIGITFWAIAWIIQRLDNLLLPRVIGWISPDTAAPPDLPPLVGAIFTFFVILVSGVIVRHFFGHEIVRVWERMLSRVPVARSIYAGVKQLFEAVVQSGSVPSYNRVILIEYPRRGLWALAFTTGAARGPVADALPKEQLVNCFVPTTPNPTSGFYLVIPESDVREVDIAVEDAFKVIMSAGLVSPGGRVVEPPAPEPLLTPEPEAGPR